MNKTGIESKVGGAPKLFTEEILSKTYEYLENYKDLDEVIPTKEGLADFLGIWVRRLYDWVEPSETDDETLSEKRQEFSHLTEILMTKQGKELLNNSLVGKYNSSIAKLLLGKHGYKEEKSTEHSGSINLSDTIE